ncbi:MAG: swr complex subunit [Pleopsidium flavum]|nr:MAG: swr complex subunit [Pleopsidium flavum]
MASPTPNTNPPTLPTNSEEQPDDPDNSSTDEDFNPGTTTAPLATNSFRSESSDSDSHKSDTGVIGIRNITGKRKSTGQGKRSRKRKTTATEAEAEAEAEDEEDGDGELGKEVWDSGDEATVRKGRRRKGKGGVGHGDDHGDGEEDEEKGGEGGLVKTRAQRAREEKERKPLASADNATVDVDALWRNMTSAQEEEETKMNATQTVPEGDASKAAKVNANGTSIENGTRHGRIDPAPAHMSNVPPTEEMIIIKRTYAFAGETITEEKLVPKSSAEARLYLQPLQEPNGSSIPVSKPPLRRPKKRTSMFEPNPDGIVKGLAPVGTNKGPKLNTIEKSKLDWAGFVDKEGIAEELDDASKAKEGYLGRMDFLGRVEAKRDEEMKSARKK